MLLVPARSKCTVADWHIELLIRCYMRYRCCINERRSITVPWHGGPGGWEAETQICLQPAYSSKKIESKKKIRELPLIAESHSSLQSQFFRCSCFPVPCSFTQTSSGRGEKWCDAGFYSALDTLMEGNVAHWFQTPQRSRHREQRFFGSSPGKTLNLDPESPEKQNC